MAEVRGQKSEFRDRRSATGDQPVLWVKDHGAENFSDFLAETTQFSVFSKADVFAVACEVDARIRFGVFTITVSQLRQKVRLISSLGPGLPEVQADRPRSPSGLGQAKI